MLRQPTQEEEGKREELDIHDIKLFEQINKVKEASENNDLRFGKMKGTQSQFGVHCYSNLWLSKKCSINFEELKIYQKKKRRNYLVGTR